MKLKGVSTLEFYLTQWLHDHGFPHIKARVAADFQYNNNERTIYFALTITDEQDKKFLKYCQEVFRFPYECDNFIISFFHELGHYATWNEWSADDWNEYLDTKCWLIHFNRPIEEYFDLSIEARATEWACNLITSCPEEIEEFWRVCQKLIMNIYKQNGVVGE